MAATMRAASAVSARATAQPAKLGAARVHKAASFGNAVVARRAQRPVRFAGVARAAAGGVDADTGIKKMREGVKEAADENLLTPRFYTTDFDEMEQLFSSEINPNLDQA
jgi:magnesium-protoporphyrin IX monomethyl ester (oxidative) cyclase